MVAGSPNSTIIRMGRCYVAIHILHDLTYTDDFHSPIFLVTICHYSIDDSKYTRTIQRPAVYVLLYVAFLKWGYPERLISWKMHPEMDDDWGYPHSRKPWALDKL